MPKAAEADAAVAALKGARPQANPYVEPWRVARARLLAGREEECFARVHAAGGATAADGGDWIARDWGAAQRKVLVDAFARASAADVDLVRGALAAAGVPMPPPSPPPPPPPPDEDVLDEELASTGV